jgi:hypothetical protein
MADRPYLVFCGRCRPPTEYDSVLIEVILGGKIWGSLQQLRELRSAGQRTLETEHLQPFAFRCPEGHPVDGNLGDPFPIAIAGASGASKSHFLPAIVRDLHQLRTLRAQGVQLERLVYGSMRLAREVAEVYDERRVLAATRVGRGLAGPYAYRLRFGQQNEVERSLLLFDIAGEAFADPIRIGHDATYLLLCRVVIYLVDPVGLVRTKFDDQPLQPASQFEATLSVRRGIETIVETLEEARSDLAQEHPIPICVVIAKADAVHWPPSFDWGTEAAPVEGKDPRSWTDSLEARSESVRAALTSIGAGSLVEQVHELRGTRPIRFAVASATSVMPDASDLQQWAGQPEPRGIALVMQHVLDLTDEAVDDVGEATGVVTGGPEHGESAGQHALSPTRRSRRRTLPIVRAALVVALATIVVAAATVGGHVAAARTREVAASPLATTQSRSIALSYPASWHGGAPPAGLNLQIDLSLRRPAGGGLVEGEVDTTSWLHLPTSFVALIDTESLQPQLVSIDGAMAFEFVRVMLRGHVGRADLVTIPIDQSSALMLLCWGAVSDSACQRVMGSVRLRRKGVDPRPDGRYASAVSADLLQLGIARARWLRTFGAATTAIQEANAALKVSTAYTAAARGLQRIGSPLVAEGWASSLSRALLSTATGYEHLAADVRRRDRAGYGRDRDSVLRSAAAVDRAITAVDDLGFNAQLQQ